MISSFRALLGFLSSQCLVKEFKKLAKALFPSPSGVSIFSILPRPARCLSLSQHRFAGGKKFLAILPEKTAAKKPATPVLMGCAGKITRCTPTVQFCTVPSGNFFHYIWYISIYAEMHHILYHRHVYDSLEHPY